MADRIEQARQALLAGNNGVARSLISSELKDAPANPDAWLFAALLANTLQERQDCIQRALAIDPQHLKALEAAKVYLPQPSPAKPAPVLSQQIAQPEPAYVEVVPEVPRTLHATRFTKTGRTRRPWLKIVLSLVILAVLGLGFAVYGLPWVEAQIAAREEVVPISLPSTPRPLTAATQPTALPQTDTPAEPTVTVALIPGFPIMANDKFMDDRTGISGLVPSSWQKRQTEFGLIFVPDPAASVENTDGMLIQWSTPAQWASDSVEAEMEAIKSAYTTPPPNYDSQLEIMEDVLTNDGVRMKLLFNKRDPQTGNEQRYASVLRLKPYEDGIIVGIINLPQELFESEESVLYDLLDSLEKK